MKRLLPALLLFSCALLPILPKAQTTTKPAIKMNHLAFHVSNLAASTDFYTKLVGLDTIPEPFHDGRHTWLSLGNGSHLHLIMLPDKPVVPGKNSHLCLTIPDVPAFAEKLKKLGIAYEDWPGAPMSITTRVDGVHQLYFKDPDGYWLEINDAKE